MWASIFLFPFCFVMHTCIDNKSSRPSSLASTLLDAVSPHWPNFFWRAQTTSRRKRSRKERAITFLHFLFVHSNFNFVLRIKFFICFISSIFLLEREREVGKVRRGSHSSSASGERYVANQPGIMKKSLKIFRLKSFHYKTFIITIMNDKLHF